MSQSENTLNISIIYNKNIDNPSYKSCIEENIVKNEKGEVDIKIDPFFDQKNLQTIQNVKSGRGLYRAWISNLQKCIRRGMVKEAIHSFYECSINGSVFLSNAINRICKVIVSEDIGCANNNLVLKIVPFLNKYENSKIRDISNNEFINEIIDIIEEACNGYKSRIVDNSLHLSRYLKSINVSNFEESFNYLKESVKNKNILNSINAIEKCIEYKNEKVSFERIISKDIKPLRMMNIGIYKLWNWIVDKRNYNDLNQLNQEKAISVNTNLFCIWYLNSGKESILNIIHAICNILFQKEIFSSEDNNLLISEKNNYNPFIKKDDTIWILSASYDKHTRRWKDKERNSIQFFQKYGSKLDKCHPNLEKMDNEIYNALIYKLNYK